MARKDTIDDKRADRRIRAQFKLTAYKKRKGLLQPGNAEAWKMTREQGENGAKSG